MNLAMILEMAADAFGDRVAIGNADDGVSYEELRACGAGHRRPRRRLRRQAPRADRAQQPPRPRHPLRGRVGGRELRPAQLPAPRRPARGADRPHRAVDHRRPNWVDAKSSSERAFPESPELPAVLLFTSGTSAAPKAAILEHDQLLAYVFNTLEFGSAGEDEASLVSSPPFHIAGVAASAELHLHRPAHRAAAGRALLRRGLDRHRPPRVDHARDPRAHHARPHRRQS